MRKAKKGVTAAAGQSAAAGLDGGSGEFEGKQKRREHHSPPGISHCRNANINRKAARAIRPLVILCLAAEVALALPPARLYWMPPTIITPMTTTPTPAA